ncbi:helix-turn-helix domain-containing protein [Patescibacteria group bacterium]|nr:helix-turn-helix domain-containing protein [Patescibacteria group bacterium]
MIDSINENLIRPEELAKLLNVSKTSVYRIVESRAIPFFKIKGSLRFEKSDIADYLKSNRVESIN